MKTRPRPLRILFCAAASCIFAATAAGAHRDISPEEAHSMLESGGNVVMVDVREDWEFCGSQLHIEDSLNLPWVSGELSARYTELPSDHDIIVICGSGGRSNVAANFLDSRGFPSIFDVVGGIGGWTYDREECDPEPWLHLSRFESEVEINWTPTTGKQDYDLLRGYLEDVADGVTYIDLGPTDCLLNDSAFTYHAEPVDPPPGHVLFYLSRQKDSPWGWSSGGSERWTPTPACN